MKHHDMILTATAIGNINIASYLVIFAVLVTAAIIDIKEHIIPDNLIITGVIIGLTLSLYNPQHGFLDGFIGGMTAGLILLVISYITKGGLGLGDVKLFVCIGIYLGLEDTASAMLISAVLSGLFSLVLISVSSDNKKLEIPFAPFILAGALAAVIL